MRRRTKAVRTTWETGGESTLPLVVTEPRRCTACRKWFAADRCPVCGDVLESNEEDKDQVERPEVINQ